jgi:hypothetical protein
MIMRILFLLWAVSVAAAAAGAHAQQTSDIPLGKDVPTEPESASVASRLEWLKTQPSLRTTITTPDHWVVLSTPDGAVQWSFTPSGHYAHPAVVRRELKLRQNGDVFVEMTSQCEAVKKDCDKLLAEFERLNERMAADVQRRLRRR